MPDGDALDALRAALPAWVVWSGPVWWIVFGAVLGGIATWAPMRLARRAVARSVGAHWTERARQRAPFALAAGISAALTMIIAALLAAKWTGPLSPIPMRVVAVCAGLAAYAAAILVADAVARPVAERIVGRAALLRHVVASWLLLKTGVLVMLLALAVIPTEWGPTAWLVLLGAVALNLWLAGGACVTLLRALRIIVPATAVEERLAAEVARAAGCPAPNVLRLRVPVANAMALFLQRTLLITGPAREVLSDAELRAVLAHEVGHLLESRGAKLRRVVAGMLPLALPLAVPLGFTYGPAWALLPVLVLAIAAFLLRHVSLRHETDADRVAHEHELEDGAYARALEALHRFNLSPAVTAGKVRSHPDLYDRLLAAGVEPEYARPEPPPKARGVRLVAALVTALLAAAAVLTPLILEDRAWRGGDQAELALAATGGHGWLFERYGWTRLAAGDDRTALLAARAAAEVAAGQPWRSLAVIDLLAACGADDEDRALFDHLVARHPPETLGTPHLAAEFAEHARDRGHAIEPWIAAGTRLIEREARPDAWAATRLGQLWRKAGDPERSRALLDVAVVAAEGRDDAWLCAEVALLARALGQEDVATQWQERAFAEAAVRGFSDELRAAIEARSAERDVE